MKEILEDLSTLFDEEKQRSEFEFALTLINFNDMGYQMQTSNLYEWFARRILGTVRPLFPLRYMLLQAYLSLLQSPVLLRYWRSSPFSFAFAHDIIDAAIIRKSSG